MSTTTVTAEPIRHGPAAADQPDRADHHLRVTQARVIKSEWVKLRSLRSTLIALGATMIVVMGLGMLFAAFETGLIGSPGDGPPRGGDPTGISLSGVMLGQLIIGSLGVMITAGEYSTGMIRSSLAAVPRRLPMLWGKVIVFAGVTFVLMLAATFVAFLGGQAVLSAGGGATAALGDTGVLRAIVGGALTLTGVGLFGLALGALLRSTAGAISGLFGIILLLPGLSQLLPGSWSANVTPNLPSNAIAAFMRVQPLPGDAALSPSAGLAVFAGYLLVLLISAGVLLKRRDA